MEGELYLLEVMEVMRCTLEAGEGRFCLREVLEVPEVMRLVFLCMLEAVEGDLCLLEVMRCALLCMV